MRLPVRVAEKQKATATNISGLRIDDSEREAGGHRGIDRPLLLSGSNLKPRARRELVDAGDMAMRSMVGPRRRSAEAIRPHRLQRSEDGSENVEYRMTGD